MLILAAAVTAYLIGSIPTAYVIGKRLRGIDILRNGSGNIGAMNAYEVTGSKAIGIGVGAIDVLKGLVVTLIFDYNFGLTAGLTAALFAVVGHNYSIFINFRGGRGLATAAGALLIIQPLAVAVYLAIYFVLRIAKLKLYVSSVAGILCGSIPVFLKIIPVANAEFLTLLLLAVILSKHVVPLKNELQNAQ